MVQLLLPRDSAIRLETALRKAGAREVGGILMGEHVADGAFRVVDFTVQSAPGSFARFVRSVIEVIDPLTSFFRRTDANYRRFNYLGEWHSHPSFTVQPSSTDLQTMWEIIEDTQVGAHFAVMMIVRINLSAKIEASVTVFTAQRQVLPGTLAIEEY